MTPPTKSFPVVHYRKILPSIPILLPSRSERVSQVAVTQCGGEPKEERFQHSPTSETTDLVILLFREINKRPRGKNFHVHYTNATPRRGLVKRLYRFAQRPGVSQSRLFEDVGLVAEKQKNKMEEDAALSTNIPPLRGSKP